MTTPEGRVQDVMQTAIKRNGGIVRKMSYEGRVGAPDLISFFKDGRVLFIECKRPGGRLSSGQEREIALLATRGVKVYVYDGATPAEEFLHKALNDTQFGRYHEV